MQFMEALKKDGKYLPEQKLDRKFYIYCDYNYYYSWITKQLKEVYQK